MGVNKKKKNNMTQDQDWIPKTLTFVRIQQLSGVSLSRSPNRDSQQTTPPNSDCSLFMF